MSGIFTITPPALADIPPHEKLQFLYLAAAKGCTDSMNNIGVALIRGDFGLPVDRAKAMQWFTLAMEKTCNPLACNNAAILCHGGFGNAARDDNFARELLRIAIGNRFPQALQNLALLDNNAPEAAMTLYYSTSSYRPDGVLKNPDSASGTRPSSEAGVPARQEIGFLARSTVTADKLPRIGFI